MDNRARASLTYRILTEVLGLALVLGAFSLSLVAYEQVSIFVRDLLLYAIVFAVLITIWRRLGGMFDLGILGGKVSALIGMVIALDIALAPVFLRILIADNSPVRAFAANVQTAGFGLVMLLMMFLVRRSHAYKSKSHWRVVHHALLIAGGIFLLSMLAPMSWAPVAEIPGRAVIWVLALVAMPVIQRFGSGMLATPAQPHRTLSSASSAPASASSLAGSSHSSPSANSFDHSTEDKEGQEGHRRPPRRGRGRFHRHSGPSRRRM
jgi:hypothetical protein